MAARLEALLAYFLVVARKPWVRRLGMLAATLLFAGGLFLSVTQMDGGVSIHSWGDLAFATLVLVPFLIALNGMEMKLAAGLVGVGMPFVTALRVSVQASAANLLPLPAGPMLRAAAVMGGGASLARGGLSVLLPAFLWLALGLLISAVGGFYAGAGQAAAILCLLGLAVAFLVLVIAVRTRLDRRSLAALLVVKLLTAILDLLALYLLFEAIGVAATLAQAGMLAASAPLGAAVAVVPSGLGVRELAASGLGVMAGLSAASAFLVPSLLRIIFLAVLLPLSLVFAFLRPGS